MKYATIVLAVVVGCAVAVVPAQQPTVLANPLECEICRKFEPVLATLAGEEESVVEAKLDEVCDHLDFLKDGCKSLVDRELKNIVAALKKDPKTVCVQIHLCSSAVEEVVAPVVLSGDLECIACKYLEPLFLGLVNKDKAEIEQTLNKECSILGSLKNICINFVDSKIDALVAALNKEGANADTICADIGACSKPASRAARVQQSKIDPKCLLCHLLGPTLEELAGKEEPVIQKELDTICKDVLGWEHKLAEDCVNYINKEGAMIAKVLAEDNGSGAKELCEKIKWCPVSLVEAKVDNFSNIVECDLCKALGPQLEKLAGKEESVIVKELDTVCEKLPFFKQGCEDYIDKEGAKMAKILAADEGSSAHVLCEKLHMCKSALVEAKVDNLANALECEICGAVGPELEKLAGQKEGVVVKDLEIVCARLGLFATPCENWVDKEGVMIAKVLTEDEGSSAHVLCQKLHMCKATVEVVEESKFDLKCTICKDLGPELERLAKKEEGVVAKDLEHICDKVPIFGKECEKFIEREAVMIAKVLTEDAGSGAHELCEKIGWC